MSSREAVLWLVGSAMSVAVIGHVWRKVADAAARRTRQQRYQSTETRPQRLASQPGALSASMGPERAASIRRSAESAALLASRGQGPTVQNPYQEGSPEFVLWVATYHLTLTELAEQEHADSVDPAAPGEQRVSPP